MPEPERFDWHRHYAETPIPSTFVKTVFWGTVLGGFAITIVFQIARFLLIEPIFGFDPPRGRELAAITFSMTFVCSVGYAIYGISEEIKRRGDCMRRGLTLWKD